MGREFKRVVTSDLAGIFVNDVKPVRAFDFYGYTVGWRGFAKIELLNPAYVFKCADLLLRGKVFDGVVLQPHESHIPFALATMADYNLQGCGWMELNAWSQRSAGERTAWCGEEVDVDVCDIRNRWRVDEERLHDTLFEPGHSSDSHKESPLKIASLREVWKEDIKRRDELGVPSYSKPSDTGSRHPTGHWERADEHEKLMIAWLEKNKAEDNTHTQIMAKWIHLKTRFEAVRSREPPEALTPPSWVGDHTSSTAPDAELPQNSRPSPWAVPSISPHRVKRRRIGETLPALRMFNRNQVMTATRHASTILRSQYRDMGIQVNIGGTPMRYVAPSRGEVASTLGIAWRPGPFYGDPQDVSLFPFAYAGREIHIKSRGPTDLPRFGRTETLPYNPLYAYTEQPDIEEVTNQPVELRCSPSRREVVKWHHKTQTQKGHEYPFKAASLETRDPDETEDLSILALEVHVQTRPGKVPLPSEDAVAAVFWQLLDSNGNHYGAISTQPLVDEGQREFHLVDSETALFDVVVQLVRNRNPDILMGYETNASSWGYLNARYDHLALSSLSLWAALGRVKDHSQTIGSLQEPVKGRHIINMWDVVRKEVTLGQYSLEYVVFHTMHECTPHYSFDTLREWWNDDSSESSQRVAAYWHERVGYVVRLVQHLEIIGRYCSQARLYGVDWWSALTRGSQFMVEAVLTRLARRENFVLVSPSPKQVGEQQALEFIPLVMEPLSSLYTDPVCVLDFRSLYPSIVIAYNLCYSTCLGRVTPWRGRNKLGIVSDHLLPQGLLDKIGRANIWIAPNGMAYVRPNVRRSLLAQMLQELLVTRIMLNDSRRHNRSNSRYQRNLNNQQLALKFIANVIYGYTAASFSGRMPCAELADSIVCAGREILTQSISSIESCAKWHGTAPRVVYGDTDSLFVMLPGVTREQAFRIGSEIADMVTQNNPAPILLKLEKVYDPCILQTKKRYVGRSFERPRAAPKFDAKGTETVRRDGTPIVQKLERQSLELLFDTGDLSLVKSYLQSQWLRLLSGQVSIQELCFAQQVKLGTYSTSRGTASLPGGAVVSLKRLAKDEGALPQYRERVPFVVTAGPPGTRIADRCVAPEEMMDPSSGLIVDAEYYITQAIIPPLERLLNMVGVNVREWYRSMGRRGTAPSTGVGGQVTSRLCIVCMERPAIAQGSFRMCAHCASPAASMRSAYILAERAHIQENRVNRVKEICRKCSGIGSEKCVSLDCPVYYERCQAMADAAHTTNCLSQLDLF